MAAPQSVRSIRLRALRPRGRRALALAGWLLTAAWPGAAAAGQLPFETARRAIRLEDLPAAVRELLPDDNRSAAGFDRYVESLERETAARQRDGEYDHLIFFLLLSQRFTSEPRIEPAVSALELARTSRVPVAVRHRLADFERALAGTRGDPWLSYFKALLERTRPASATTSEHLLGEYGRVMRFLYRKEFLSKDLRDPQALEAFIAALYRERGHSTDTQVEANFAVHTALAVVRASGDSRALDRALIVGPGLDFAPRTDLQDRFEPQSYQPFAVADALLGLGFSTPESLRVHCVDINARVNEYLKALPRETPTPLRLFSGVPEREDRPLTADYREYFQRLGSRLGRQAPLAMPAGLTDRPAKTVLVRPQVARAITADRLNIVTERYEPSPGYDLVVVTNVFSYFDPAEQALALSNIESMLRPGGYLIHNEPQNGLVSAASALGMTLVQARTVVLASGRAPLFDRVLIHRKSCRPAINPRTEAPSNKEGV